MSKPKPLEGSRIGPAHAPGAVPDTIAGQARSLVAHRCEDATRCFRLLYIEDRDDFVRDLRKHITNALERLIASDLWPPFELWWLPSGGMSVEAVEQMVAEFRPDAVLLDLSWTPEREKEHGEVLGDLAKETYAGKKIDIDRLKLAGEGLSFLARRVEGGGDYGLVVYSLRGYPEDLLALLLAGADGVVHKGSASALDVLARLLAAVPGMDTAIPWPGGRNDGGWIVTPALQGVWERGRKAIRKDHCLILPGPMGVGRRSLFHAVLRDHAGPQARVVSLPLRWPALNTQSWLSTFLDMLGGLARMVKAPVGLVLEPAGIWLNPGYPGWGIFVKLLAKMDKRLHIGLLLPPQRTNDLSDVQISEFGYPKGLSDVQIAEFGHLFADAKYPSYTLLTLPSLNKRAYGEYSSAEPNETEIWPLAEYLFWRALVPSGVAAGLIDKPMARLLELRSCREALLGIWMGYSWEGQVSELASLMAWLARHWGGTEGSILTLINQHRRLRNLEQPLQRDGREASAIGGAALEAVVSGGWAGSSVLRTAWETLDELCAEGDKSCYKDRLNEDPKQWHALGVDLQNRGVHKPSDTLPAMRSLEQLAREKGLEQAWKHMEAAMVLRSLVRNNGNQRRTAQELKLTAAKLRVRLERAWTTTSEMRESLGAEEAARQLDIPIDYLGPR